MKILKQDEFLSKELNLLIDKQTNSEVEWEDIADLRYSYTGEKEHKDTIRKGSKLLYEFLNAGWNLSKSNSDNSDLPVNIKQTTTINADKTEDSESQFYIEDESKLRDSEYLLKLHNYDPHLFELVSAKNSKWNSGGKNGIKTLYSSKITVKPRDFNLTKEDLEAFFDRLSKKYVKPKVKITKDYANGDKLLLIPISDLHFNLLATLFTTGNEYNCKIAEELFFYVINDVISRTKDYKFKKIIFTIGGDMLNADSPNGCTYKGTPQDNEKLYYDACDKLYELTIKAVDILADVAYVDVIYIPSNHDLVTGWNLAKQVWAWFRNDSRVNVDTSISPLKYIVFGKTLFVFGHDADIKKLPKIIPDKARDVWSSINFTEVFLQHLHSEQVLLEENNMRIQRLPTISANSKWSVDNLYNSKRQNKSFIYDLEDGLTDVIYTIIKK